MAPRRRRIARSTRPRLPAACLALLALLAACGQPAPPYAAPGGTAPSAAAAGETAGAGGLLPATVQPSPFRRDPFPPPPPAPVPQIAPGIDNSRTEQAIGDLEGRVDENRFGRASDCRAAGGIFTVTGCLPN